MIKNKKILILLFCIIIIFVIIWYLILLNLYNKDNDIHKDKGFLYDAIEPKKEFLLA